MPQFTHRVVIEVAATADPMAEVAIYDHAFRLADLYGDLGMEAITQVQKIEAGGEFQG